MTEADSILLSILSGSMPLSVFADWLEQEGDARGAEWMRGIQGNVPDIGAVMARNAHLRAILTELSIEMVSTPALAVGIVSTLAQIVKNQDKVIFDLTMRQPPMPMTLQTEDGPVRVTPGAGWTMNIGAMDQFIRGHPIAGPMPSTMIGAPVRFEPDGRVSIQTDPNARADGHLILTPQMCPALRDGSPCEPVELEYANRSTVMMVSEPGPCRYCGQAFPESS
jgi:hypothetical protein